jgi:hypothetical protein
VVQLGEQPLVVTAPAVPRGSTVVVEVPGPTTLAPPEVQLPLPTLLQAESPLPANMQIGDQLSLPVLHAPDVPLTVALGNRPVEVAANPLATTGELTVRVQSLGDRPVLTVVSARPEPTPLAGLQVGDQVNARVVATEAGGPPRIEIAGQPIAAEVPPGLPPGTLITLEVASTGPRPVLDIVAQAPPAGPALTALLRDSLPVTSAIGEPLANLQQTLQTATGPDVPPHLAQLREFLQSTVPGPQPQPDQVARWARDSGQHFEARLTAAVKADVAAPLASAAGHDLKGLLLQAIAETRTTPSPAGQAALPALVAQLHQIEGQQATNALARLHDGPIQFQVPMWNGQALTTAALSIEPQGQGNGGGRGGRDNGHNVLFLLDLTALGPTRIDAQVSEHSVRAILYVAPGEASQQVQAGLAEFRQSLTAQGFREVLIGVRPLAQIPPEKQERFQAMALGTAPSVSLVDTRA